VGVTDVVLEELRVTEIEDVKEGDIVFVGVKDIEFEGLAASFPTVISIPHTSGVFIVISYLQMTGSLTAE
jgi:hypothetical protein